MELHVPLSARPLFLPLPPLVLLLRCDDVQYLVVECYCVYFPMFKEHIHMMKLMRESVITGDLLDLYFCTLCYFIMPLSPSKPSSRMRLGKALYYFLVCTFHSLSLT